MTIRRRGLLAGTAALPLFAAHTAVAQTALNIQIAASHPVQNFWIHIMKNVFQPEVDKFLRDNGNTHRINWREAYGGTLYRFQDTMEAVRDNITDIGYVGTLWEGSTMPLQNVTYFTPFATGDHGLIANAFEHMNETVPAIRQNWNGLNMIPLSSYITDTYHIWSNFPIRTLDDLRNGGWRADHLLHRHPDRRVRRRAVLLCRHPPDACV
jgi:TRAP-type C4-dicarboxylate transport system substrate-binding protein